MRQRKDRVLTVVVWDYYPAYSFGSDSFGSHGYERERYEIAEREEGNLYLSLRNKYRDDVRITTLRSGQVIKDN